MQAFIKDAIQESILAKEKLLELSLPIEKAIKIVMTTLKAHKKLLIAGNGGSAADAQHFAAELVVQYTQKRAALPAIALTTDSSILTACSNDFGYEYVFERQIEALGQKGDLFIGLTSSGNSKNMVLAVEKAQHMGLKTLLFLGRDGGSLKRRADVELIIPSVSTSRIQECHELIYHIICEAVEKECAQEKHA